MPFDPKKPLAGKKVVVTRQADQAADLVELLAQVGAKPIVIPTIAFEPPDDLGPLENAKKRFSQYEILVFTSVNAVINFYGTLSDAEKAALAKVKVAAIGSKTAGWLAFHKIRVDIVPPDGGDSENFFEVLSSLLPLKGKEVLLPMAQEGRGALAELMRKAGANVDVVPVYKTVSSQEGKSLVQKTLKGKVDWITFASGSAARAFLDLAGAEATKEWISKHGIQIASIGDFTSGVLIELGLEPDAVADEPTVEAMVRAIMEIEKR